MSRRTKPSGRRGDCSRAFAPAFTLLEVLVAIGAVALIGLGLARIFGATSETLRVGRRVSHFSEFVRILERTMRDDFSRMSRQGFLVIAHEQTANPIERFPNDRFARKRRIDQIMFFENGRFQTLRVPLYPGRVATGAQARVYYGHGLRQQPGTPNQAIPSLDDPNRDGAPGPSGGAVDSAPWFGRTGPNRYASDWILSRHVTVLTQPRSTPPPRPNSLVFPTRDQWPDNDLQVDLSPAASSIFRNMARGTPDILPGLNAIARPRDTAVARPNFASGLVDIATTDLSEIRSIILDAQGIPQSNPDVNFAPDWATNTRTAESRADRIADSDYDGDGAADGSPVDYAFKPDLSFDGSEACFAMKQWMLQALPAEPRTQTRTVSPPDVPRPSPGDSPDFGGRLRVEPFPPDYLGTRSNNGQVYLQEEDYRRTDQTMLASSAFAPACTEFIVEFSFGQRFLTDTDASIPGDSPDPFLTGPDDPRANQLLWHGLDRIAETDFVTGLDTRADRVASPYAGKFGNNMPLGVRNDSPIDLFVQQVPLRGGGFESWPLLPAVIHEPVDNNGLPDPRDGEPFYSIFGYVDPTFPGPLAPSQVQTAADYARLNRPDTIPCPWPRLIRITMTLADPGDPTVEQTFQFIFEVPQEPLSSEAN